jgi:hypothetical protein
MSATTGGALKAHLESPDLALGVAVFRDRAPKDQRLPFIVVTEGIAITPERHGDHQDPAANPGVSEVAQVSLFQAWRGSDGKPAEDYTLARKVYRALHGSKLLTAPTTVYGVAVSLWTRVPAVDGPPGRGAAPGAAEAANVVHDAFTLTIRRNLT